MGIESYSTIPDANTTIGGIFIGEGCDAKNLNDAMRQFAADMKTFYNTYVGISFPITVSEGGTGAATAPDALAALNGLDASFKHLPQSAKTGAFTFALAQDGGHVYYTGSAAAATIPTNASVAFAIGTIVVVVNDGSGALTLTRAGGVSLKWANTGANADRALAVGGVASIIKVGTDAWFVSGAGLT